MLRRWKLTHVIKDFTLLVIDITWSKIRFLMVRDRVTVLLLIWIEISEKKIEVVIGWCHKELGFFFSLLSLSLLSVIHWLISDIHKGSISTARSAPFSAFGSRGKYSCTSSALMWYMMSYLQMIASRQQVYSKKKRRPTTEPRRMPNWSICTLEVASPTQTRRERFCKYDEIQVRPVSQIP